MSAWRLVKWFQDQFVSAFLCGSSPRPSAESGVGELLPYHLLDFLGPRAQLTDLIAAANRAGGRHLAFVAAGMTQQPVLALMIGEWLVIAGAPDDIAAIPAEDIGR